MKSITLTRRIEVAKAAPGRLTAKSKISPASCPAIRAATKIGVEILSPIEIKFDSALSFDVMNASTQENDLILIPGIIGGPDSKRIYARIDSGFSIFNLKVPFLTTLPTSLVDDASGFVQPNVLYEVGYSGPLLVPLSATEPSTLAVGDPISHLVPLYPEAVKIEIDERLQETPVHPEFEGLLNREWPNGIRTGAIRKPLDIWLDTES